MSEHSVLLAVQRQVQGLVNEKFALQMQIAALVMERDALREQVITLQTNLMDARNTAEMWRRAYSGDV
jgi:hypothetical protein